MTVRTYVNSAQKRADTVALLDSGATENFIHTDYAYAMRLPLKRLMVPRQVFNVDKTRNKNGDITHYTDLVVRTGERKVTMRFFLTNLGEQRLILGYPWFAAMQPHIDWVRGRIEYEQLPIVLTTPTMTINRTTQEVEPEQSKTPLPLP